ncbi:MAG TPA: NfeD family protein [Blastocatellia bacterium]|jgi:membrane protein implicated in regulation of membrane protease activity|nr:NfeD family protein [Blastocatellia bacterium]
MSQAWAIWLIIAAIFVVAEVFTSGFFLLWFGVGALVAATMAILGVSSLAAQTLVFLIVSVALVIASRTIFERFFNPSANANRLMSGIDTIIGQVGMVVESSRGALNEGAVSVYGSVWTAFPAEGERPLREGDSVSVERIEGNAIYVRRTALQSRPFTEISEE